MTPTPAPTVSFASDVDGDLHMFSQDPDTAAWRVFVPALPRPAQYILAGKSGKTDTPRARNLLFSWSGGAVQEFRSSTCRCITNRTSDMNLAARALKEGE